MDIRAYHNAMLSVPPDTFGGPGTAADCDIWLPFDQPNLQTTCGAIRAFSTASTSAIEYGVDGTKPYRNSKGQVTYRCPIGMPLPYMASTSQSNNWNLIINYWIRKNGRGSETAAAGQTVCNLYFSDTSTATMTQNGEYMSIKTNASGRNTVQVGAYFYTRFSTTAVASFNYNAASSFTATDWHMVTLRLSRSADTNSFYVRISLDAQSNKWTNGLTQIANWPRYFSGCFVIGDTSSVGYDLASFRIRLPRNDGSLAVNSLMNRLYTEFNQ